ncbi:hypothetical protein K2173_011383 [Erythroxylum novogranatense]|uniref:Uncharacterized protein n=1 Tax=Erythroxylum novogranatense TaxID=1862640 RepID=A0AAV8S9K0_9ROSI|nr:hypothetical protein K2173_011383 [Erythroxylum novogranatense]
MAIAQETVLYRLDRLDNMLRELEELRGCNRSSGASTLSSSGTGTEGQPSSSVDFSPKSLEQLCRPIDRVMMETQIKGNLVDRLDHVEDRVMKLEAELGTEKQPREEKEKGVDKKGLKGLVNKIAKCSIRKHKSEQ